jgi:hypothetical protein
MEGYSPPRRGEGLKFIAFNVRNLHGPPFRDRQKIAKKCIVIIVARTNFYS